MSIGKRHQKNISDLKSVIIKRDRAETRIRLSLKVLNIYFFSSYFLFSLLKKVKPHIKSMQKNKKPNPSYMHIKKLVVREELILY